MSLSGTVETKPDEDLWTHLHGKQLRYTLWNGGIIENVKEGNYPVILFYLWIFEHRVVPEMCRNKNVINRCLHTSFWTLKQRGKSSIYYVTTWTIVDALYNAEVRSNIHFIVCARFLLNIVMLWGLRFGTDWPTFLHAYYGGIGATVKFDLLL